MDINPNIYVFIYLIENVVFLPRCLVKAVQDDIFAKTVPSDCITHYSAIMAFKDEDNILYQMHENKLSSELYCEDFKF